MRPKILVTGANGYIASLVRLYNADAFDFTCVSHSDLDFSKTKDVADYFEKADFDIVFHTAANTTTADCERDPEGTHRINSESAIEIARICAMREKRMIFLSTEQLFNGKTQPGPFKETEEPLCVTDYGKQKLEVDSWIRANLKDYVIFRLSWQFGLPFAHVKVSPGILERVMKAVKTDTPTKFTVNEKRCMTYAQRLADGFGRLTEAPTGVYNIASENDLTTYESARYIAKRLGCSDAETEKLILPDYERYADRFRDYRLDANKTKELGVPLATFEEDVDTCLKDFGLL